MHTSRTNHPRLFRKPNTILQGSLKETELSPLAAGGGTCKFLAGDWNTTKAQAATLTPIPSG